MSKKGPLSRPYSYFKLISNRYACFDEARLPDQKIQRFRWWKKRGCQTAIDRLNAADVAIVSNAAAFTKITAQQG